jgi:hypothetical protein
MRVGPAEGPRPAEMIRRVDRAEAETELKEILATLSS